MLKCTQLQTTLASKEKQLDEAVRRADELAGKCRLAEMETEKVREQFNTASEQMKGTAMDNERALIELASQWYGS